MDQLKPKSALTGALDEALSIIRKDFSKLGVRLRTLEHTQAAPGLATNVRVHYPSLRDGESTIEDLIRVLAIYMMHFALPRKEIMKVRDQYGAVSADDYELLISNLKAEARNIFIKANKATNRNGEGGELFLYLLTEWILDAPQLLAKMRLKTSPNMPVHGADGIHIKFCKTTKRLLFYWGESKLYADIGAGVHAAMKSVRDSLSFEKLDHEFSLVRSHIDFSGLDVEAKAAILAYLDPFDEHSNERVNIITCLIAFDFKGYADLKKIKAAEAEKKFCDDVRASLPGITLDLKKVMSEHGLEHQAMEIFFIPVPEVQKFRDFFQAEIGWKL